MSRKFKKEDGYKEEDLLHFGFDHIDTGIELLKNGHHGSFDSAGYLIQLGLELVLKSCHLHILGFFKDEHNLNTLINGLKENGCVFTFETKEKELINTVNDFYLLRYPRRVEGSIEIGSDQVDEIDSLLETIWNQLPDELIKLYEEIDRTKKDGRQLMEKEN